MRPFALTELAGSHLATAHTHASGRSAQTIYGGSDSTLRQTLIALAAGQKLDEHENPGQATVHVLTGRVRMAAAGETCDVETGSLLAVPDSRHSLEALEDAVILLTVAKLA